MKVIIRVIILCVIISCNNGNHNKGNNLNRENTDVKLGSDNCTPFHEYPEKIVHYKLFNFFDNAKWLFYACNYNCRFINSDNFHNYYDTTVIDYTLVSHDIIASIRPVDTSIVVGFTAVFKNLEDYTSNFNTVFSNDENYFNRFETMLDCDSVMYRHLDKFNTPRDMERYFYQPKKYKEELKYLNKTGVKSIHQQLEEFEEYLRTTEDTITDWLECEAVKRGIIKKIN